MNIAEARAKSDGIDYYINKKNITISAKRNENGDISVTKEYEIKPIEHNKVEIRLIAFFLALIFTLVNNFISSLSNHKLELMSILAFIWFATFLFYFVQTVNPKNIQMFKYHAAEHKALNYWDEYKKIPANCSDVMKMSSISYRCGSTLIAIILVVITLTTLGILFIPWIALRIIWCLVSILVITPYLWINGKLNFLQKMVLREPELAEVEVSVQGMSEYIKTMTEESDDV